MAEISPTVESKEGRNRIFAAAAKLFAQRGYGAVSMREIAEAASVSKPMLYYYFSSKLGLCRALIEEGMENFNRASEKTLSADVPLPERLQMFVRAQYQHVRENPDLVRFHINFFLGPDETGLAAEFRNGHKTVMSPVVEVIAEGQAKGAFRADMDPRLAANAFMGAVNVHIGQSLVLGTPSLDDELAAGVTDIFLHGIST